MDVNAVPASVWNNVQCPEKYSLDYEGMDEAQCDLRINHKGDCKVTVTWKPFHGLTRTGPHKPLRFFKQDDPNLLAATTLEAYMPMLLDQIFKSRINVS